MMGVKRAINMGIKKFVKQQARRKLNPTNPHTPSHIPDQKDLIEQYFDTDGEQWLIFMDAGRYDFFDQLHPEYLDGELTRAWNGSVGYTGDWAMRNLRFGFGDRVLVSWLPLRSLDAVSYDGRNWFAEAPDIKEEQSVDERLTALGYRDGQLSDTLKVSPDHVNNWVKENHDRFNGGVIRYLKPHPPFAGMEHLTSTSKKLDKTWNALETGEITYERLTESYEESYRIAFEKAVELVNVLEGDIIITSDHGTCLGTCGQLFHGRNMEKHDHLTVIPWFKVNKQ